MWVFHFARDRAENQRCGRTSPNGGARPRFCARSELDPAFQRCCVVRIDPLCPELESRAEVEGMAHRDCLAVLVAWRIAQRAGTRNVVVAVRPGSGLARDRPAPWNDSRTSRRRFFLRPRTSNAVGQASPSPGGRARPHLHFAPARRQGKPAWNLGGGNNRMNTR